MYVRKDDETIRYACIGLGLGDGRYWRCCRWLSWELIHKERSMTIAEAGKRRKELWGWGRMSYTQSRHQTGSHIPPSLSLLPSHAWFYFLYSLHLALDTDNSKTLRYAAAVGVRCWWCWADDGESIFYLFKTISCICIPFCDGTITIR